MTMASSVGVLAVNFMTGVLVCRVLEPDGRGQIAAISTWTQIIGWAAAMGFYESMTWMRARNVEDPRRLLGTGLLVTLVLGTAGVIVAECLLPYGFRAQRPEVLMLARIWMFSVYISIASSMCNAMITGDQQFGLLNLLRLIQPLVYLLGLATLWLLHRFSVPGVLAISTGCEVLITGYLLIRLGRTIGFGLPSLRVLKLGLTYGMRVQGALFANLANSRLDMMLLPAVLHGAVQIGLYSVSTNLSGLIVALLGSFSLVIFPAAARAGLKHGLPMVARTLRLVFFGGLIGSAGLFVFCPIMLHLVYGPKFDSAVPSLRILLPGAVAMACTKIVDSGLQAVNQPMKATWAQLVGLAFTLIGLALTLKPMGIEGAALTSTISYTASFLVSLYFLARVPEFPLREAFSFGAFWSDAATVAGRMRQKLLPAAEPAVIATPSSVEASLELNL
jgi:antigen flippase